MKKTNRLIVGSALGLAAIAVAIDHTQHRLPDPIPATQDQNGMGDEESPCGMGASPCSMDMDAMDMDAVDMDSMDVESESPCSMSMDSTPCGLVD